jgi:hypothetical protein
MVKAANKKEGCLCALGMLAGSVFYFRRWMNPFYLPLKEPRTEHGSLFIRATKSSGQNHAELAGS